MSRNGGWGLQVWEACREGVKSQKLQLGRVRGDRGWRLQMEWHNIYGTSTGAGAIREEKDRMAGGRSGVGGGGHSETGDWGLGGGTKPIVSLTVEHIFSVAGPDFVVRLLVGKGAGSRGVAGHHVEACVGQLVKSLL